MTKKKSSDIGSELSQMIHPSLMTPLQRRDFLRQSCSLTAYLSLGSWLGSSALLHAQSPSYPPLRRLIWINLNGGWDILEVTDPKRASTSGIDMSYSFDQAHQLQGSSGAYLGRWVPRLAQRGEDIVVVRGIAMGTTSHEAGRVYMDTGVLSNAGQVNAASIPAIVASESLATIPLIQLQGGSGVLSDRGLLRPVSVVRAGNLDLYRSMYPEDDQSVALRLSILDYLKSSIAKQHQKMGANDRLSAIDAAEAKIREQVQGRVSENLSLSDQEAALYTNGAPQRANENLLRSFAMAAKLIKSNVVTCVNLGLGGFDTHSNQEPRMMPLMQSFDHALSVLIDDLKASGDLDSTLIVCHSDFGRTPKINRSNGRDHWPVGGAFLIGGGIEGGRVVGGTDDNLLALATNPLTGVVDAGGIQMAPGHLGGAVLALCLGEEYHYRQGYLDALPCLLRLRG